MGIQETAPVLRCASCGAPAQPGDVRCTYCKASLATVACPHCFALVHADAAHCPHCGKGLERAPAEATTLPCPACGEMLTRRTLGSISIQPCESCGGLWMSNEAFQAVTATHEDRGTALAGLGVTPAPAPPTEAVVRYRKCPECQTMMNRQNYARISGVILDVCRHHGTWFDADELRRVLDFIESGGLERARQKELISLQEAQRARSTPLPDFEPGSIEGESQFDILKLLTRMIG